MTAHTFAFRLLAVPACCLMLSGCFGADPESEEPVTPPPAVEAPAPQPAFITYTVRSGDTLSKISRQHHVSVADICAANGITPKTPIKVGRQLKVPGKVEQSPAVGKPVSQTAAPKQEAAKAEPRKVEPAAEPAPKVADAAPTAAPKSSAPAGDAVHQKLDAFAQKCVANMNRQVLPSKSKKEVVKNSDGTFTCRYIEVDPASVTTSYKKPESSTAITYVGYLRYNEVEYVCKAPTKQAAMDGPFKAAKQSGMTELVKYVKTDWSY